MKSVEGRGPKAETRGAPGCEEEGKRCARDMEGNVLEKKVPPKPRAEEPTGRGRKGRHGAQGSRPPHCGARGQPAPVGLRDVALAGRRATKARARLLRSGRKGTQCRWPSLPRSWIVHGGHGPGGEARGTQGGFRTSEAGVHRSADTRQPIERGVWLSTAERQATANVMP